MTTYNEEILKQRIATQRKSDTLLGKHRMDYEQFCEAIDEIIPADIRNDKGLSVRELNKAMGQLIHEETKKSYYDIYLGIKFNTTV